MTDFGDFIKVHRKAMGYTQATFADAMETSRRWVSRIERGHIHVTDLATLESLATTLGVPFDDMIVRSGLVANRGTAQTLLIGVRFIGLELRMDELSERLDELLRELKHIQRPLTEAELVRVKELFDDFTDLRRS